MNTQKLYYTLNEFLKEKFGEKVKKIPLDAGLTCPNRDGTKGFGGCIYCDPKGSGTGLYKEGKSLDEQLRYFLELFKKKNFKKFIAYFQSFSNTYAPIEKLKKLYDTVFIDPSIVGLAIGTRPDCVDEKVVNLLKTYQEKGYYLWIELGLQSIYNETLKLINRGHTFEDFLKAYYLLKENDIPVVVHIIFGLPKETKEMMMETVKTLAKLKIDGIKFHALYIPKGSKMEKMYLKGEYNPLKMEEYVELVAYALTYLPPSTVIHRVCSEAREEDILAPTWVSKKMEVINLLRKIMNEKKLYQGKNYQP
uniref:TIGR01212 family radical SAM protein n=1 Tax=Thermodesulfobacterium geofontis TaxID=1295609 RepID=A0A7V5XHX9_9BACT